MAAWKFCFLEKLSGRKIGSSGALDLAELGRVIFHQQEIMVVPNNQIIFLHLYVGGRLLMQDIVTIPQTTQTLILDSPEKTEYKQVVKSLYRILQKSVCTKCDTVTLNDPRLRNEAVGSHLITPL
jgi:hypothetical protein